MEIATNSTLMRQGDSNRNDCNPHSNHKNVTSHERPVHISVYLNRMMDAEGKCDRKKLCELFNTENYG